MSMLLRRALMGCAIAGLCVGTATAQDAPPTEVMHWWTSGGEAAGVKVFADRFDAAGGRWVDNAVAGGENARAAAINRIVGGNPPASSQFNTGRQFDDLVGQGLLADMSAVAAEGRWADVMPAAVVAAASRQGSFYAVPVNIHGQNWMFTNKDVFAKAGITEEPASFDALFAALDKLKAAGVTPIAWGGQPWQEALVFDAVLLGQGGKDLFLKVYRDRDEAALASPELLKVAETFGRLRDYVDAGAPGRAWNDATSMVISGQAGLQIMGDWAKGDFINAGMAPGGDKTGCVLVPGGQGYVMGGDVFVFPKLAGAAEPTPAQALLAKTMLDPVTQVEFSQKKGSIPVRTDVDTAAMDACAQKGIEMVRDPAMQIPSVNFFASADAVGAIQDAVTDYFNTKDADPQDFVDAFADAVTSGS